MYECLYALKKYNGMGMIKEPDPSCPKVGGPLSYNSAIPQVGDYKKAE